MSSIDREFSQNHILINNRPEYCRWTSEDLLFVCFRRLPKFVQSYTNGCVGVFCAGTVDQQDQHSHRLVTILMYQARFGG